MGNLGQGNDLLDRLHHSQPGAQDRHQEHDLCHTSGRRGVCDRRVDRDGGRAKVAQRLVGQESGHFRDQLPECVAARLAVTQLSHPMGQDVLAQRVSAPPNSRERANAIKACIG